MKATTKRTMKAPACDHYSKNGLLAVPAPNMNPAEVTLLFCTKLLIYLYYYLNLYYHKVLKGCSPYRLALGTATKAVFLARKARSFALMLTELVRDRNRIFEGMQSLSHVPHNLHFQLARVPEIQPLCGPCCV